MTMEENIIVSRQKAATLGRLSLISAITMLPVMTHGCLNAYITVALPKFQHSNSTGIVLDFRQVSWIGGFPKTRLNFNEKHFPVSLNQPSWMFGLMLAGLISEGLGRKKALLVCSLLQILTTLAVPFCNSFISLLLALTFLGGFNAMILNPSFAFLSEISLIREALKNMRAHIIGPFPYISSRKAIF